MPLGQGSPLAQPWCQEPGLGLGKASLGIWVPDACGKGADWGDAEWHARGYPAPLIHSTDRCVLNACNGPGTVLGTGEAVENKPEMLPPS